MCHSKQLIMDILNIDRYYKLTRNLAAINVTYHEHFTNIGLLIPVL